MDRVFYVSQVVEDRSTDPPRQGAMHFTTPNEGKARSEQALDHPTRFLLIFEDGVLVSSYPSGAPEFMLASAKRKETQRRQLQAASAGG